MVERRRDETITYDGTEPEGEAAGGDALSVSCPYCGSPPGTSCETDGGEPTDPHQDRRDAA